MTDSSDLNDKLGDIAARAGISRIHVLAWRDLDDVEAGGSEVHAHEVLRRWAEAGIEVVMRTSFAQGHPPRIRRAGYQVVRRAGRYLVFPRAVGAELSGRHGERDALVEIWNGMPFMSPLWARGPRVVLLHHVHAEMWRMVLPPGPAAVGDWLESRVAPRIYRRSRIITLSPSSRQELVDLGFDERRVEVVPPGIDERFSPGGVRSDHPLVVAVGRLEPVKRFDRLIRAVAAARASAPDLELIIVGSGSEREGLQALIEDLDASSYIDFAGRIDDGALVDLYRRAWAVASSSVREGWGMTLTEAAACGTPAVATRIAGHVDAVAEGTSGLLADDDTDLSRQLARVATDAALRTSLQEGALAHAATFSWDRTSLRILEALAEEALSAGRGRVGTDRPT